jgi:hypothetical protein
MPTRFIGGLLKKLPNNSVGETTGKALKFYGDILGKYMCRNVYI